MRYFRIVSFSGIEAHRDDADRGSLRLVEGCIPHGQGGLRSAPVWEEIAEIESISDSTDNQLHGVDFVNSDSLMVVSRGGEVHDIKFFGEEGHENSLDVAEQYPVVDSSNYINQKTVLTPIGNRVYSFGDGSEESLFVGLGNPVSAKKVFPDLVEYHQEWSRFPFCTMFLVGPKKTIFAAGNPDSPLTVYITEPAGLTNPERDAPYSTEETSENGGVLSSVDIMMSNASRITALSVRGDSVVVHTDKGCHLLSPPSADQANSGYRVEQAPSSVASAATNIQVVQGETNKNYWLGHDKQVYKDESATRGAEFSTEPADSDQASAKAKGIFEKEVPDDNSNSFATYSSQGGMYWFFVESDEFKDFNSGSRVGLPMALKAKVISDVVGNIDLDVSDIYSDKSGLTGLTVNSIIVDAPDRHNLEVGLIVSDPPDMVGPITNLGVDYIVPDKPGSYNLDVRDILSDLAGDVTLNVDEILSPPGAVQLTIPPGLIEDLDARFAVPEKAFLTVNSVLPDVPDRVYDLSASPLVDSNCDVLGWFIPGSGKTQRDLYASQVGLSFLAHSPRGYVNKQNSSFPKSQTQGRRNEGMYFPGGGVSVYNGKAYYSTYGTQYDIWVYWPKFQYWGIYDWDQGTGDDDSFQSGIRNFKSGIGRHAWRYRVENTNGAPWWVVLAYSERYGRYKIGTFYETSQGTHCSLVNGGCKAWGYTDFVNTNMRGEVRYYIGSSPQKYGVCTPEGFTNYVSFPRQGTVCDAYYEPFVGKPFNADNPEPGDNPVGSNVVSYGEASDFADIVRIGGNNVISQIPNTQLRSGLDWAFKIDDEVIEAIMNVYPYLSRNRQYIRTEEDGTRTYSTEEVDLPNTKNELLEILATMESWGVKCYIGIPKENDLKNLSTWGWYNAQFNVIVINKMTLETYESDFVQGQMASAGLSLTKQQFGDMLPQYRDGVQFLETFRHEAVHAAQDYEAGITNGTSSLLNKVSWNALNQDVEWVDPVNYQGEDSFNFIQSPVPTSHGQVNVEDDYIGSSEVDLLRAYAELEGNMAEVSSEIVQEAFKRAMDTEKYSTIDTNSVVAYDEDSGEYRIKPKSSASTSGNIEQLFAKTVSQRHCSRCTGHKILALEKSKREKQ